MKSRGVMRLVALGLGVAGMLLGGCATDKPAVPTHEVAASYQGQAFAVREPVRVTPEQRGDEAAADLMATGVEFGAYYTKHAAVVGMNPINQ